MAFKSLRHVRGDLGRRTRVGFPFAAKHILERAIERHAPCERLVQCHAHAVPIVAFGWSGPRPSLRGQVRRRPCHALADGRVIGKDVARKTEIENHDAPVGCDQDVGRLDVAMKLAPVGAAPNPVDELPEDVPDALRMERRRRRRSTNVFDEVDAVHELHREETIGAVHDELVQRHQVRMRDIRQAAELALEPVDVGRPRAKQRFQRDDFVADLVVDFVDDAHAASAQLPAHREALGPSELRARSKRGQWRLNREGHRQPTQECGAHP